MKTKTAHSWAAEFRAAFEAEMWRSPTMKLEVIAERTFEAFIPRLIAETRIDEATACAVMVKWETEREAILDRIVDHRRGTMRK